MRQNSYHVPGRHQHETGSEALPALPTQTGRLGRVGMRADEILLGGDLPATGNRP